MSNSDSLFPSSTTSTIRPRNRRLISFQDENDFEPTEEGAVSSSSFSIAPPKAPSRGISPIPATNPSRRQAPTSAANTNLGGGWNGSRSSSTSRANGSTASSGLWDSWSSLQGLASTLLGSDAQSHGRTTKGAVKFPTWSKSTKPPASLRSVPQWGPSTNDTPQVAAGSQEERHAMVQAKKREALLLANAHLQTDKTGRFKRRDSDADLRIPRAQDEDAMVYVHKVQPSDTLAGVMIKYSCQQAVFRKVNRFWPNDNIHVRTHVFLPVEACGIRGRKLEDSQEIDLLSSDLNATAVGSKSATASRPTPFDAHTSSDPLALSLSLTTSHDTESFKHESWVRIPAMTEPIEILRIPRRTLGFFPPARRKSQTFSDLSDSANDLYSDSTPKTSFDKLRHPPTHAASQNASPARRPLYTRTHRSSSTATATNVNAMSFADRLKGPGGVGTLRGSNLNMPVPGPAEDSLNKRFAHLLPSLAPPSFTPKATPRSTPRVSTDSVRSNSSTGLGEMGGAIEGWVRKLGRNGGRSDGLKERMGDLIELEGNDSSAIDDDEDGDETPILTINANEEALLQERFPPRGRIREAYPGKGKGKGD